MIPLRLILGSTSPRRREILAALRIPFEVRAANANEDVLPGEAADPYLERVVASKLDAVRAQVTPADADVILVADTSVIHRSAILGKPANLEDASSMVRQFAGQTHHVKTRFALAQVGGAILHAETVTTAVTFRALTEQEVIEYAASGEGMDKAGGYAVQGLGASLVSRIEGSYSNVVGLPACEVFVALRRTMNR